MAQRDAGGDAPPGHQNHPVGIAAVVLAAGKGTRMRSALPKVLHPLLGEPMICHVLRAIRYAGIPPERTVVVVGFEAEKVKQVVATQGAYLFATQTEQLGTGHAVKYAAPVLEELPPGTAYHVLILLGDGPMLRSETLQALIKAHLTATPLVTMITSEAPDPTGYGRIVRDENGQFSQIVEEVELTLAQKAINEINPSLYMYNAKWLWSTLPKLKPSPQKGEYYLTDIPALALEARPQAVQTFSAPFEEGLGINDRVQLAEADALLRQRVLRQHMINGVTITDPASTYISALARIAPDTIIEPNTHIKGDCSIGSSCVIGPNAILTEVHMGDNCKVLASMLENCQLENNVEIGPFSHVRSGSYLEEGVHLGNYAEVNRSRLGADTRQGHFSYIGDATLGKDVNVGAGTITANYDGKNKNQTIIGDHVFLGCDTILRAPLRLGEQSATGAGSVVTKDVQAGVTVVGVPARAIKRKPLNNNNKED